MKLPYPQATNIYGPHRAHGQQTAPAILVLSVSTPLEQFWNSSSSCPLLQVMEQQTRWLQHSSLTSGAALTDNSVGFVQIWRLGENGANASVVATAELNDGGCCGNALWYD